MITSSEKTQLFERVIQQSCTSETETQNTFDGIYYQYRLKNSRNFLFDVSTDRKIQKAAEDQSELNNLNNRLSFLENELSQMDPNDKLYKTKLVEKQILTGKVGQLELDLESDGGLEIYLKEIENILLDENTSLLHELLHEIKNHATTQGYTLDDKQIKDLAVTV